VPNNTLNSQLTVTYFATNIDTTFELVMERLNAFRERGPNPS
jgi:hypothetical protein